ncbi:MAG: hypothetical protein BroJett026_40640 [Betaproteobacteria bacterium]|nr:MAG: hypothetical protein BroJett026_40640 [Betaproteobacteria bacterium]
MVDGRIADQCGTDHRTNRLRRLPLGRRRPRRAAIVASLAGCRGRPRAIAFPRRFAAILRLLRILTRAILHGRGTDDATAVRLEDLAQDTRGAPHRGRE